MGNDQIRASITKVKEFFGVAASVDGKTVSSVKSEIQLGKSSVKRDLFGHRQRAQLWGSVSDFEESRSNANTVIVGLDTDDEEGLFKCLKGIDRPFLSISADDMNSRNFTKPLGRTMLEPACTILIRTDGLLRAGKERLLRLLKPLQNLFDKFDYDTIRPFSPPYIPAGGWRVLYFHFFCFLV